MGILVEPETVAQPYLDRVREDVAGLGEIRLVGVLTRDDRPAQVYSESGARACEQVGIHYEERERRREEVSREIFHLNEDPTVHGVVVFYPVFGGVRDRSLQNEIAPEKDVEGLHAVWASRLYNDVRTIDEEGTMKAVLPCTPLGIMKVLSALDVTRRDVPPRESAQGLVATIFNRSEVVGRPLAAMLAHDGARVYSFDIDGVILYEGCETLATDVDRARALAESDVVITGVPTREFQVRADEIKPGAVCVNFSHLSNLEDAVVERASQTVMRVGPVTVAMLLRNTLRLYRNFHQGG